MPAPLTLGAIGLDLDGDGCWPDLDPATARTADALHLALLPGGAASGASSVTLRMDTPRGPVLYQVSLGLLESAVRACRGREEYLARLAA